ncbi:MAG: hypothetical protein BJ554DRAFT_6136, partial [Olpidium bornovanus]
MELIQVDARKGERTLGASGKESSEDTSKQSALSVRTPRRAASDTERGSEFDVAKRLEKVEPEEDSQVGQQRNADSASADGYPSRSKAVLQPGNGQGGVERTKGPEYSVNKEVRTSDNALSLVAPDDADLEQDRNRREHRHNSRQTCRKIKNAHKSATSDESDSDSEDEAERRGRRYRRHRERRRRTTISSSSSPSSDKDSEPSHRSSRRHRRGTLNDDKALRKKLLDTIPKYDGTGGAAHLNLLIKKFETYIEIANYSETAPVLLASQNLRQFGGCLESARHAWISPKPSRLGRILNPQSRSNFYRPMLRIDPGAQREVYRGADCGHLPLTERDGYDRKLPTPCRKGSCRKSNHAEPAPFVLGDEVMLHSPRLINPGK